jgi:hypothetical protein
MARLDGKGIIPNGLHLNMSWQRTYKEKATEGFPVAFVSGEPDLSKDSNLGEVIWQVFGWVRGFGFSLGIGASCISRGVSGLRTMAQLVIAHRLLWCTRAEWNSKRARCAGASRASGSISRVRLCTG